ncbi:MAG: hypothetical protein ACNS60_12170 [Candidatus Cyclobacteriaceae bacterium M2_1C_046]
MKPISLILILLFSFTLFGCEDEEIALEFPCMEGEVIGKIRTGGGGLAVSLSTPIDGAVTWQDRDNVVEVLNIPVQLTVEGTTIFFTAREAREGERGPITSDGDETIQMVLYGKEFSDRGCSSL